MIVIARVSTRTFSSNEVLRELASLCVSELKLIYKRCNEFEKVEDKVRCRSTIAFALHYARKTGLVFESDGGVLYFVPCLLYYRAVASYLYERPRKTSSKMLVRLQDRYRWLKIASEEILKSASTVSLLNVDKDSLRVEDVMRDMRSAVKWVMKSPLYRPLEQYTTSLSTMCRAVYYLFSVIPSTCNNVSACELNELMLTYLLGILVVFSETLVKLEYEGRLTVKNAVEILKETMIARSTKLCYEDSTKTVNQPVDGVAHTKKDALLEYFTLLIHSSISTHLAIERLVQALEKNLLIGKVPEDGFANITNKVRMTREVRKLKWICRKLLRYNTALRVYKEVSRINSEVADVLLKTLLWFPTYNR